MSLDRKFVRILALIEELTPEQAEVLIQNTYAEMKPFLNGEHGKQLQGIAGKLLELMYSKTAHCARQARGYVLEPFKDSEQFENALTVFLARFD